MSSEHHQHHCHHNHHEEELHCGENCACGHDESCHHDEHEQESCECCHHHYHDQQHGEELVIRFDEDGHHFGQYFKEKEAGVDIIVHDYKPLHAELFDGKLENLNRFLDPRFVSIVSQCKEELIPLIEQLQSNSDEQLQAEYRSKRAAILSQILSPAQEDLDDIYAIPLFTQEYCDKLLQEVEHFEQFMKDKQKREAEAAAASDDNIIRPNTMNNNGVVLEQLGMRPFFDGLVSNYFGPMARVMNRNGVPIDDHHSFIVEYSDASGAKDRQLSMHVDDSELTVNTCLGKPGFRGGAVYFCGMKDKPETHGSFVTYGHSIGKSILHDGKQMHGALPVEAGERTNLIIWLRSSGYRRQQLQALQEQEAAEKQGSSKM